MSWVGGVNDWCSEWVGLTIDVASGRGLGQVSEDVNILLMMDEWQCVEIVNET